LKTWHVWRVAVGLRTALYRVRQFVDAWLARVSSEELREADEMLPPGARELFGKMSVPDQRHSLNVMRTLQRAGHTEADLLAAALLHDVGKSAAQIRSWHRATLVLSKRFAPGLLAWLTHGEPHGWRRPFVIHRQHVEIGAQWAAQAGCSPLTVSLIRRHQEPLRREPVGDEERLLIALQHADGIN
jgi:putative nucleotidyltransferase with HDIG domain